MEKVLQLLSETFSLHAQIHIMFTETAADAKNNRFIDCFFVLLFCSKFYYLFTFQDAVDEDSRRPIKNT